MCICGIVWWSLYKFVNVYVVFVEWSLLVIILPPAVACYTEMSTSTANVTSDSRNGNSVSPHHMSVPSEPVTPIYPPPVRCVDSAGYS